jgi:Ni/Co efflux regulator RcnB
VRDYWLVDFAIYDLPPPPFGAVWVRVGFDALLIDDETGEIITVAYDVFY